MVTTGRFAAKIVNGAMSYVHPSSIQSRRVDLYLSYAEKLINVRTFLHLISSATYPIFPSSQVTPIAASAPPTASTKHASDLQKRDPRKRTIRRVFI
jgi:hypothetical protein